MLITVNKDYVIFQIAINMRNICAAKSTHYRTIIVPTTDHIVVASVHRKVFKFHETLEKYFSGCCSLPFEGTTIFIDAYLYGGNWLSAVLYTRVCRWILHEKLMCLDRKQLWHCSDVIMSSMASQITDVYIVYSAIRSGANQRKHQSSASLALWGEFTGARRISRTKGQ